MHRGDSILMAEELKYAGACPAEAPPPGREPRTSMHEDHRYILEVSGDVDEVPHVVRDSIPHASRREAFDEADDDCRCMSIGVAPHRIFRRHRRANADGWAGRPARAIFWATVHDGPGDDGDADDEHDVPYDGWDDGGPDGPVGHDGHDEHDGRRSNGSQGHGPDASAPGGHAQGHGRCAAQ